MIFRQYREIVEGKKTQTRRVLGDKRIDTMTSGFARVLTPGGKLLHEVGRTYAVVPGRGKPGLRVRIGEDGRLFFQNGLNELARISEWKMVRIRIDAIRVEHLNAISEADAKAEGVEPIEVPAPMFSHIEYSCGPSYAYGYAALWDSINDRPGIRWEDNPLVIVYTFTCVLE